MTPSDGDGVPQPPRFAGMIDGDLQPCWLCGKNMDRRALFCHVCGAIQPPRDLDHFTRLSLERRFDIDLERLSRQRAGLTKALDPGRFAARGVRQQAFSRQQADAIDLAFEVLREPVRRARYLLELEGTPFAVLAACGDEAGLLRADFDAAENGADLDRLGTHVAQRITECVTEMSVAFRTGRHEEAAQILTRLEALEAIAAEVRDRRADQPPPKTPSR